MGIMPSEDENWARKNNTNFVQQASALLVPAKPMTPMTRYDAELTNIEDNTRNLFPILYTNKMVRTLPTMLATL